MTKPAVHKTAGFGNKTDVVYNATLQNDHPFVMVVCF